jgi:hypothetical protein
LKHSFDVVVANPFFATQGLSFEVSASRILDLEVDATAFAISDVHAQHHEPPLGVLTLPPPQGDIEAFRQGAVTLPCAKGRCAGIRGLDEPLGTANGEAGSYPRSLRSGRHRQQGPICRVEDDSVGRMCHRSANPSCASTNRPPDGTGGIGNAVEQCGPA